SGRADAEPCAERPAPARDTEARCRAYEQVDGRGKAMEATAWKRLVEAAGGERNVTAYCAEQLARAEAKPGSTAKPEKSAEAPGSTGADNRSGNADTGAGNADNGSGGAARRGGDGASSGDQGRPAQPGDRRP
ncbi:hypothetical protein ACWDZW_42985, partial [Streptomyces coeruleorubidus]